MDRGTLEHILALGKRLDVQISVHGYEELAEDEIRVRDVVEGLAKAVLIEDSLIIQGGRAVSSCSAMARGSPFMWSGVSLRVKTHRRSW